MLCPGAQVVHTDFRVRPRLLTNCLEAMSADLILTIVREPPFNYTSILEGFSSYSISLYVGNLPSLNNLFF